uniref:Uncharacterized protein n=1 Tax=Arundo donax TaxID=35708 RepID=A0A0A9FTQ3_ARUDO
MKFISEVIKKYIDHLKLSNNISNVSRLPGNFPHIHLALEQNNLLLIW